MLWYYTLFLSKSFVSSIDELDWPSVCYFVFYYVFENMKNVHDQFLHEILFSLYFIHPFILLLLILLAHKFINSIFWNIKSSVNKLMGKTVNPFLPTTQLNCLEKVCDYFFKLWKFKNYVIVRDSFLPFTFRI